MCVTWCLSRYSARAACRLGVEIAIGLDHFRLEENDAVHRDMQECAVGV
jgi:hypothetical protein